MTALRARIDDPGFKALVDDFDQAWPNVPRSATCSRRVQAA
jgi:hypothetical protein